MFHRIVTTGLLLFSTVMATPSLYVLGMYQNGTSDWGAMNESGELVGFEVFNNVNTDAFDFATGLGTLSITLGPGVNSCNLLLDLELDHNTFDAETAISNGVAPADLVWEIDAFENDIYPNLENGFFDNSNGLTGDDDVVMGLGWNFDIVANDFVIINFEVSTIMPTKGFYLAQSNGTGNVYFSSSYNVPEPGVILLLLTGMGALGLLWNRRKISGKYPA